jgi:hypothetical protein
MDLLVYVIWRDSYEEGTHQKREKDQIREIWKVGNKLTVCELFTDELSTAQRVS